MQSDVCNDKDVKKILEDEEKENTNSNNCCHKTVEKPEEKSPTVLEIPIPETEKDASVEEVDNNEIELKPNLSPDSEQIVKVNEERKEYLLKRAKESNIDFDKIKLSDDGHTPLITDEMVDVFVSYADNLFDRDFIMVYIDQAKSIITQYIEYEDLVKQGLTDEDDLEYYDNLGKSYEESRLILAMIQNEYNKIVKEFKENKIFENQSKALTISLLRDFFIEKFRLTDSLYSVGKLADIKTIDKTKQLNDDIRKKLFVSPIFKEYVYRMYVNSDVDVKWCLFGKEFLDKYLSIFIFGIDTYIKYSGATENIDLKDILYKDFNNFNFAKAVLMLMLIVNNDPFAETNKSENYEKTIETLKSKLDPNGYYTSKEDNIFKKIYVKFTELLESLSQMKNVYAINKALRESIVEDKLYRTVNLSIDLPYKDFITEFATKIPDINGTSIIQWGKYYSFLKKYELYYSSVLLIETFTTDGHEPTEQTRGKAIEFIMSYVVELMNLIYGNFLSDIDGFINENVYSKEMRQPMFAMISNNILLQHELGFKSDLEPEKNDHGDELYKLAETTFGDSYKYIIIDKEKDFLLKDVNLTDTRENYYNVIDLMFKFIELGIKNVSDGSYNNSKPMNIGKKKKNRK